MAVTNNGEKHFTIYLTKFNEYSNLLFESARNSIKRYLDARQELRELEKKYIEVFTFTSPSTESEISQTDYAEKGEKLVALASFLDAIDK